MYRLATVDQLKFLFLFVLNSSAAALATQANRYSSVAAAASTDTSNNRYSRPTGNESSLSNGYINFRMARRSDIPSIQRCNLATLPENYNSNFYLHHLRSWSELALVMEYVSSSTDNRRNDHSQFDDDYHSHGNGEHDNIPFNYDDNDRVRSGGDNLLGSNYNPNSKREDEAMIIGYVLGKVDEVQSSPSSQPPPPQPRMPLPRSRVSSSSPTDKHNNYGIYPPYSRNYNSQSQQPARTELLGHVTSLAILHNYRRKGLAAQLMNQLHYHMSNQYNADAVGLHVRVSNKGATKLYVQNMGYTIADIIKGYYQDGEDAYFMRKDFIHDRQNQQKHGYQEQQNVMQSQRPRGIRKFFGPRSGKIIRNEPRSLPRRIELYDQQQEKHNNIHNVEQQQQRPQYNQKQQNYHRRGTLSFVSNNNDAIYYQYDSE